MCCEHGIIHETTSPYTLEHNAIAERYNRTLQEGALTLQHDAELQSILGVCNPHHEFCEKSSSTSKNQEIPL